MKKCPFCGLLVRDEAVRCSMCNTVLEVDMASEELAAVVSNEQRDPLEDELEAFFQNQSEDIPSPFAPRK